MGWISDRRFKTGRSLNGRPHVQRKGPLRLIVGTIRHSRGIFDPASVVLECGHHVFSHGAKRARCSDCAAAAAKGEGEGGPTA